MGENMYVKSNKRPFLPVLVLMLAAFIAVSISYCCNVYADENGTARFKEQYASPGENLTVEYDGTVTGDISYKWYMDDVQISCSGSSYCVTGDDVEKLIRAEIWNNGTKLSECSMLCSKLPVIYINTEGGNAITSKDDYISANLDIQGNEKYNSSNTTLYNGATQIKGRGNSTWKRFDKKPYKIKLDKKTDLFGMGKNKHWVLLANYIDESCMRNMLASYYGKELGTTAMDAVWVDVVLNGECIGNYQLCEQIRLSRERVDIFDWEGAAGDIAEGIVKKNGLQKSDEKILEDQLGKDMSWMTSDKVAYNGIEYTASDYYDKPESVNGGYLMEIDDYYDEISKFRTDRNVPIQFKSPEYISTNSMAFAGIQNYMQKFEDALYSDDKCIKDIASERLSYVDLCDSESLVSYWLASEFMHNEFGYNSTYMHKDIDSKVRFGPIWDFDWSSDSVSPFGGTSAASWASPKRNWFSEVIKSPYFAVKARELYLENEDMLRNSVKDGGIIDEWHGYIQESGLKNEKLWGYSRGFEEDCFSVKSWIKKRINWIDDQFASDASAMRSLGIELSSKFDVSISGADLIETESKAYETAIGNNESYKLKVDIKDGDYDSLSYYINGRYTGSVKVGKKDSVTLILEEEQLTENIGDKNVISVWLKDSEGNFREQQYCTVVLDSKDKSYCNVIYNERGVSKASKIPSGRILRIPYPEHVEDSMLFSGWSDGEKIYRPGTKLTVASDTTLNANFVSCLNGDVYHKWEENDSGYLCTECGVSKASVKQYIDIADCDFTQSSRYDVKYTGRKVAPKITVSYNGKELAEGKDYEITYKNNINAGYATYKVTGIKSAGFEGSAELTYRITPRTVSSAKISISKTSCVYNGKARKPSVKLVYNGIKLKQNTDYTMEYRNDLKVGKGSIVITGKGNFSGTKTVGFKIIPESTTISRLTAASGKRVTVKWKKQSVQTSGYQISYAANSKFKKAKTVTVKDSRTISKTIKTAGTGKTCYVKVRTYKAVNGSNYYSAWSGTKKIKIK